MRRTSSHSGAAGYGFLMAASGVGSLLAALWLAFGDGAQVRRIAYGAILLGLGEVALGVSQIYLALAAADGRSSGSAGS